ncbi:MAG TPA: hypothetical protein VKR53_11205 [Puia sp.]|nr:hypothetical protein [Puia sp.]
MKATNTKRYLIIDYFSADERKRVEQQVCIFEKDKAEGVFNQHNLVNTNLLFCKLLVKTM